MKMKYTSEETFKPEDIEIPDDLYEISKELLEKYGNYGPRELIIRSDKKSLCFAINKIDGKTLESKSQREIGSKTNLFRVTIEKIGEF